MSWWGPLTLVLVLCGGGLVSAAVRPAWVIPETANVRKSPSEDADRVAQASRGTKVYVDKFSSGWCHSKLPDGTWGWIREDLLQFSADKGRQLAEEAAGGASTSSGNPPVWTSVDQANVRSGPGLGHTRYGTLPRGTKCYVLKREGEWLYCRTPGGWGWISKSVVTFDVATGRRLSEQKPDPQKAFINGEVVNLRKGPGTNHDTIARLREGQTVWILGKQSGWTKIRVNNGSAGWVSSQLLKYPSEVPEAPPNFPSTGGRFRELTAWVDEDSVNVRESPGQDGDVKFQLGKGTKVTVAALEGHWCKIRTESGQYGWVAGWVVDFSPPGKDFTVLQAGQELEADVGWVARPEINLRSGPGENYPRVGSLTLSTPVFIVSQKDQWLKVAMDNREVGWVASWLIDTRSERMARQGALDQDASGSSPSSPALAAAAEDSAPAAGEGGTGSDIVHTAKQYLGNRYVRGGESPGGFDCSGFVQYVLGRHGVSMNRTSPAQFRQGRPVSRENLSPGDVVFFENTYRAGISHVGIYVGGGIFIHASNPSSGVKLTELDSSYYATRYVGARRMQ